MENTFVELKSLLLQGPVSGKKEIFYNIFEIILSCIGGEETKQYFTEEFLKEVFIHASPGSPYNGIIYDIFINIFSEDDLNERLSKDFTKQIIFWSLGDILERNSKDADSGCKLLSNITRFPNNCEIILNTENPSSIFSTTFEKIIAAFTTIKYNDSECSLDQLAMVICNLSQLTEIRNVITEKDQCILLKLAPFMSHESLIRRRGIVGVVRNCAFDTSIHQWMLGSEVDLLPYLLLPLAGPDQFDDEDNDKLPFDLQFLPDTKRREPDPEIRKLLLETLNQLCATRFGREYLRDKNAYIILRELHKWEQDPSSLMACENVVDILIKTEDEIGIDHLKSIDVPQDLEEKFSKVMTV